MKNRKLLILLSLFILLSFWVSFLEDETSSNNESYADETFSPIIYQSDPVVEEWIQLWGGSQWDFGYSTVVDSSDFIYVGGETNGFGAGDYNLFLVKYNVKGDEIWSVVWDNGTDEFFRAVSLDSSDNIYILGAAQYGTFPDIDTDLCLIKYSSSGNQLWNRTWGGDNTDYPISSILIDSNNSVYIAGYTNSYGMGSNDALLIKYNSTGDQLWNRTWGGTGSDRVTGMALDELGNIHITGNTGSYGSYYRTFVLKYNSTGTFLWETIPWGQSSINDIIIDSSDNIYTVGSTSSYGDGVLLMKFNSLGEENWWAIWEGPTPNTFSADGDILALDSSENVYIAGTYDSKVIAEDHDMILLKYDNMGNEKWYDIWGGNVWEDVQDILIDSANNIFILGVTESYGQGFQDLYLRKYDIWGELKGDLFWGGTSTDRCYDMALDSKENIYIAGDTFSFGSGNSDMYLLKYDNAPPQIDIISPFPNEKYGNNTFFFNLTIIESHIDSTWYTLNGDISKIFFSGTYVEINQSAWDKCGNGTVSIRFYVNDTLEYTSFAEVSVLKDFSLPYIQIITPEESSFYSSDAPNYEIYHNGDDINSTWYSLNLGNTNKFVGTSGIINPFLWDICVDGRVIMDFYINDSTGWSTFDRIIINKDSITPNITVLNPTPNQLCGNKTINFDLNITDINLNSIWYSLNNGLNYTITNLNGIFDQTAWDKCKNGTVNINFYANDSSGNVAYKEVIVRKETSFPNITILSPSSFQLFGKETLTFDLSIIGSNIEERWYSLNEGTNYFFSGESGIIDQMGWDTCGNGTVSIRFYANNSAGNTAIEEVTIYKDELGPIISIVSPTENQMFGNSTFSFNLNIIDGNLDSTWYSLDSGMNNYTFIGTNGIIDQNVWNDAPDGPLLLTFYANDTLGSFGYNEITIIKDATSPYININYPISNDLFGNSTINYDLTIIESYLQSTWYTLDRGLTNYTFSNTNGVINQSAWDVCENGTVLIGFYAKDFVGHLSFDEVIVRKDNICPNISILTPIGNQVFGDSTFDFDIMIIEPHLNTTWYTFDGGVTNYIFFGFNGIIDQGAWDSCNGGELHLRFYANDSVGNLVYEEVVILKYIGLSSKTAFAVIVGIANYPGTADDLMYCGSDANTMQTMLRSKYNVDPANVIKLTNEEATRSAIFNAFAQIDALIGPNDVFIFYYSGHGGDGGIHHFICPHDSIPSNPSMFIYDNELDMLLDQVACSIQYVLIDACNSGGFIPEIQASNRFIMTACTADQLSWETSGLGHGVFTYYFVDSIFVGIDSNGDGVLSMEEQFSHTSSETISYMMGFGELQQPSNYDGVSGPAVLFPSLGSLSLLPIGNELHFSFNLYGHGLLQCLNITVCSVYKNISLRVIDLRPYSSSNTGFGYYSGTIQLEEGYNLSGYELRVEIEGYSLITIVNTFGDTDDDGLYDILEIINGLNPALNDTDSDGISDFDEYYGVTNPLLSDTDGDGMPDGYEVNYGLNPLIDDTLMDLDNDGLFNIVEYSLGTYVNNPDTDGDGISDGYEVNNDLDPFSDDANLDYDDDGLVNILEFQLGSAANNTDSDNDMMPDLWEYQNNLDLLSDDANLDYDNDGLENILEFQLGSAANNADSDNDTMPDLWEYQNNLDLLSNDANLDPDEDGLQNSAEFQNNTDPHLEDTDGDEWSDGDEVNRDTDPTDPDDYPRTSDPTILGYNLLIIIGIFCVITTIILKKRNH